MPRINKLKRPPWLGKKSKINRDSFYNTSQWLKLRKVKLMKDPLCEHCKAKGMTTPATEVDHVNPISWGGDPTRWANLQSLCKSCHSIKTANENK